MGEETICRGEGMRGQVSENEGMRGRFLGDAGTACRDRLPLRCVAYTELPFANLGTSMRANWGRA